MMINKLNSTAIQYGIFSWHLHFKRNKDNNDTSYSNTKFDKEFSWDSTFFLYDCYICIQMDNQYFPWKGIGNKRSNQIKTPENQA